MLIVSCLLWGWFCHLSLFEMDAGFFLRGLLHLMLNASLTFFKVSNTGNR